MVYLKYVTTPEYQALRIGVGYKDHPCSQPLYEDTPSGDSADVQQNQFPSVCNVLSVTEINLYRPKYTFVFGTFRNKRYF
jgi:hypothetical protein